MAAVADNQLYRFMQHNERRVAAGKTSELILDTGGTMKYQPVSDIYAGSTSF